MKALLVAFFFFFQLHGYCQLSTRLSVTASKYFIELPYGQSLNEWTEELKASKYVRAVNDPGKFLSGSLFPKMPLAGFDTGTISVIKYFTTYTRTTKQGRFENLAGDCYILEQQYVFNKSETSVQQWNRLTKFILKDFKKTGHLILQKKKDYKLNPQTWLVANNLYDKALITIICDENANSYCLLFRLDVFPYDFIPSN